MRNPIVRGADTAFAVASSNSYQPGLTKREYFAAVALQGLLNANSQTAEDHAEQAIACADALIDALNKTQL